MPENVGLQGFAPVDGLLEELPDPVRILPRLRMAHIAMDPHERKIDRRLDPADHAFLVIGIVVLAGRTEEPAGIVGPPGKAGGHLAQPARDLAAEGAPVGADIPAPGHGAIALDAREGAPGQDDGKAVGSILAKSVIDRSDDLQRINVAVEFTRNAFRADGTVRQVVVLRLRRIQPPCVDPHRQQPVPEVFPIARRRVGLEEIHPVRPVDIVPVLFHLPPHFRALVHLGPHGQHQVLVHSVELPDHARRVGVFVLVEPHGIPAMFSPPLPVLDDGSHRNAFRMETAGGCQEFLLRIVPFPAMDIPERPVRHRRHRTAQAAERVHDGIGIPGENGIVDSLGNGTMEGGFPGDPPPAEHGRIPLGRPNFHPVLAGLQTGLGSDGRRKPEIGKVHEDLPVHREILFPGHGTAHIQQ